MYQCSKQQNFHSEEKLQEWENRIQHFKRLLEHASRDEMITDLYKTARDLYIEWELLNQSIGHEDNKATYEMSKVGIGEHQLPLLPYSYDALEPYIDQEIMKLHHLKHHKSYVEGLNKAEREMLKARKNND